MGFREAWGAVAAQRMGEPVLVGVLVGGKGAGARATRKAAVSAVVGQLASTVGGVVGDIVEGTAEGAIGRLREKGGSQPPPPRQATVIPLKDFAYLALSATKLGLFRYEAEHWKQKDKIKEPMFIINRTNDMALQLDKKKLFYCKVTLIIPGYLPTPLITYRLAWKDVTKMAQELNKR